MQLVFNELSADGSYESIFHANEGIKRLISIVCHFVQTHCEHLIMPKEFRGLELCHSEHYSINDLFQNSGFDRDSRVFFIRCIDKSPYYPMNINTVSNEDDLIIQDDYYYNNVRCFGFGLASEIAGYTISLDCNSEYCLSPIAIEHHFLDENADISTHQLNIPNIYSEIQIDSILNTLKDDKLNKICTGDELLDYIAKELNHLALSDNAAKQIQQMHGNETYFPEIRRHLNLLNQTMNEQSQGRYFDPKQFGLKCSPESPSTLNMYSEERTFKCSDGMIRVFSLHTKINIGAWRIYYEPDMDSNIVHIGTITKHLHTVSES